MVDAGASWPEIGQAFGMPAATASARYHRAMQARAIQDHPARVHVGDPSPAQTVARVGDGDDAAAVIDDAVRAAPGVEAGEARMAAGGATLVQLSAMTHRVVVPAEARAGWERWVLLTSDHHFDSVACDRDLLAREHDQAAERGAGILAVGDLFDAMQGRLDRRHGKAGLRPEYVGPHYTDAIVDDAAAFYGRYASHYWLVTYGNHETKHRAVHETDILRRMVREVNRAAGTGIMLGAYRGTLNVDFAFPDGRAQRMRVAYHHGHGGGGPVTGGVIGAQRAIAAGEYDLWVTGHVHERWLRYMTVETVDDDGRRVTRDVPHVCCGAYLDDAGAGEGWHVETGKPAKPRGGWWARFYWSEVSGRVRVAIGDVDR